MLTIRTKEELKRAKENKVREFIVVGELAQKLHKAEKISKLSKTALAALVGAIGIGVIASPITGGASLRIGKKFATATAAGVSTSVIYAAITVGGVALVYALYKEYNVKVIRKPDGSIELKFYREGKEKEEE